MLDYIYLSTSIDKDGFLNNITVKYDYLGPYPTRSYFAFFPNHRRQNVDMYHTHKMVFEKQGVCVKWRKTGKMSNEKLPDQFFFLTEMHYGGGGCYSSSDRWTEANGTAIGLR